MISLFQLTQNLCVIQSKIHSAADHQAEITIVAVTKTFPCEAWNLALKNNLTKIGESRIQEAENKIARFKQRKKIETHLIGHLQSNKVTRAIQHFDIIQTVDSIKLLNRIDKASKEKNKKQKIFLQVNTGRDPNKFGFLKEEIFNAAEQTTKLQNITLCGLMTIPPQKITEKNIGKIYKKTCNIKDRIQQTIDNKCQNLSMGMSNDFEIAIKEGATHIRIGTGLFGDRLK